MHRRREINLCRKLNCLYQREPGHEVLRRGDIIKSLRLMGVRMSGNLGGLHSGYRKSGRTSKGGARRTSLK